MVKKKPIPYLDDAYKARFLSHIEKSVADCWNWTGQIGARNYGLTFIKMKHFYAHRVAYSIFIGSIPAGLSVCHRCDNRKCVNPEHLFVGSDLDNMRDMVKKGRHWQAKKTHCPKGHPYEGENLQNKYGKRQCVTCRKDQQRIRIEARRINAIKAKQLYAASLVV